MYPTNIFDIKDMAIRSRIAIERRIVRSLVTEFLSQGFSLSVFDGEERSKITMDAQEVYDAIMNTDEDILLVYRESEHVGSVKLVYGNDGWDVMNDWHTVLDPYMPLTLALVESLQ